MVRKFIEVQDCEGLVRDKDSSAILNIDEKEFAKYKRERKKLEELEILKYRMGNLEEKLDSIIELLKK